MKREYKSDRHIFKKINIGSGHDGPGPSCEALGLINSYLERNVFSFSALHDFLLAVQRKLLQFAGQHMAHPHS